LPELPFLARIPSLRRAKQGGRVYHFELRSNKRHLALEFVRGAVHLHPSYLPFPSHKPISLVAATLPES